MDKEILKQYVDACELIRETKREIKKLQRKRKQIERDCVKGSSHEFPYTMQSFTIEGIAFTERNAAKLERLEEILTERVKNAERIRTDVDEWLLTVPSRMQRIVRYRAFESLPWDEVARRMGRRATPDSVRMEYERFLEEK